MAKVIILAGISGAGKSTYGMSLVDTLLDGDYTLVSSDQVRADLFGSESEQGNPSLVFAEVNDRVEAVLEEGGSPIVDATNLAAWQRSDYVRAAQSHEVPVELHYLLATFDEAVAAQDTRQRTVPTDVIVRQAKQIGEDMDRPLHEFLAEGLDLVKFIYRD